MNSHDIISLISKIREKANRFIEAEMLRHGIKGIVTSHGDIIFALFKKHRLSMAEIAEKIGKDKSTVTALVDKLVYLGYVRKERDTEDARVVSVTLTERGKELEPAFEAISDKIINNLYCNISEKEKVELMTILTKIYDNL